jgi:hypothetical protein
MYNMLMLINVYKNMSKTRQNQKNSNSFFSPVPLKADVRVNTSKIELLQTWSWNLDLIVCIWHVLSAIGQLVACTFINNGFPLLVVWTPVDPELRQSELVNGTKAITQVIASSTQVQWLMPAFSLLAALHHGVVLIPSVRKAYIHEVESLQGSWIRWLEYSWSASLMNVCIAWECGLTDLWTLINVGSLTALLMVLGLIAESTVHTRTSPSSSRSVTLTWTSHMLGWAVFTVIWAQIWTAYGLNVNRSLQSVPAFIHAIVSTLFVLECFFGVVQIIWIWTHAPTVEYAWYQEYAYDILSFVAKTTLSWLVLGGLLHLQSIEN